MLLLLMCLIHCIVGTSIMKDKCFGEKKCNKDQYDDQIYDLNVWMIQNGKKLKESTYELLRNEGIETINDLKEFTEHDFEKMSNKMNKKIINGDKMKIINVLRKFEKKDKFIDPDEVNSIQNIINEISIIKNISNNLNITQKEINNIKNKIEKDINNIFNDLILNLKNRKKYLLLQLNNIINTKNKAIINNINIINDNMLTYNNKKEECEKLIKIPIEINELSKRKKKIINVQDDIIKNNKNIINIIKNTQINKKITFIINKDDIIKYLNKIGVVSDEAVPELIKLEDDNAGNVMIVWKLLDNNNGNKKYSKLRAECSLDDINNKIWKEKDISIDDDYDEKNNDNNNISIHIDKIGVYLFRIKLYDDTNKEWTSYSDTKSIKIVNVRTPDTWYKNIIGDSIDILDNDHRALFKSGGRWHTAFCNKIVKYQQQECYQWVLKINVGSGDPWIFIGLFGANDTEYMNNKRTRHFDNDFVYRGYYGKMRNPSNSFPKATFKNVGDVLRLTLDMKKMEVRININNIDYGAVPNYTPQKQDYRLGLSIYHEKFDVEFL